MFPDNFDVEPALMDQVQVGLGVAKPAALLVSQDFFAELRLPYSVKRGERFPLNVTIFNYIDVSSIGTEIEQINIYIYDIQHLQT